MLSGLPDDSCLDKVPTWSAARLSQVEVLLPKEEDAQKLEPLIEMDQLRLMAVEMEPYRS